MRKNSEGEIRVRCAEAERGFLAGVKEMVKMRAEMGVMPWGKHVFYPRMLHKARPQKVSDFLVEDERWYVSVREVDIEKWGEKHHCTGELVGSIIWVYCLRVQRRGV